MAKVLVIGGAGYVGSATCAWLIDHGHAVHVLDDLSTGFRDLVLAQSFTMARAGDRSTVKELLSRESFDCVMHFAARSIVSESVRDPDGYRENNFEQTRTLLETLLDQGVHKFIFSSTCAIFGDPGASAISELTPKRPTNPYGETKLQAERLMEDLSRYSGLQVVALRYFNAAGAEPELRVGEQHREESHLIPNLLRAAREGSAFRVFGTDYPSEDGTCIRDYVHVSDLAAAHEAAMKRLLALGPGGHFDAFNLGSEKGYSVREVLAEAERVTGRRIELLEEPRRPGDPPRLVADAGRAQRELGFRAGGLDRILSSAWEWEKKRAACDHKAIFLDRDGTINHDPGYLSRPEDMKLLPRVGEALRELQGAGFKLVIVSNQSGVGRGLISRDALPRIHSRLEHLLNAYGVRIDHYELCLHKPDANCPCRKPNPKLILDAASALRIDLQRSYMIGDKRSDILAGVAAGARASLLVRTGYGAETERMLKPGEATYVGDSLKDVAHWILENQAQGTSGP